MKITYPMALAGICLVTTPVGCLDHPLKPVAYVTQGTASGNQTISLNRDVDILFVIDNSGSMAEEQATLAANFSRFIDELEAVNANYRIAITTTDNGTLTAGCGGSGPEAGRFQTTSCLQRGETEFTYNRVSYFDSACADICDYDEIAIQPTTTIFDSVAKPRPWIERTNGVTNLPQGMNTTDAFQCLGPQGVVGCGYESPLESMYLALNRAQTDSETSSGFLRPGAILAVVVLTDEEDCSARKDAQFKPAWASNEAGHPPTSGACWRYGVECTGGPGTYQECHPADIGVDGQPTSPQTSVLYPVQRYIDYLNTLEAQKRELDPDAEVLVAVLAGVPPGYEAGESELVFDDGTDAEFLDDQGIGPGCASPAGRGVPPVRLRAFAEAFNVVDADDPDRRNIYSICNDDYSDTLDQVAAAIGRQLAPACMTSCVLDTDPTTAELDPKCAVTEEWVDEHNQRHKDSLPPCVIDENGPSLPKGVDVCYYTLADAPAPGAAPTPGNSDGELWNDLAPECASEGWNLQFDIVRSLAGERPRGSQIGADCLVSSDPKIDCAHLGSSGAELPTTSD